MSPQPAPISRPADEELMDGVRRRDPEALSQLYDRYSGVLKAVILRIVHNEAESEDLLQEIYMEIWNHSQSYEQERGKALGWMVTLTRRRSIDRLRKRLSYARVEERLQHETEHQSGAWNYRSADDDLEASDMRAVLIRIMDGLPPAQRDAIELAYFQGMSQREIAAHTGIPLGTIKTRLELGLKKISDGLKGLKHEF